MTEAARASLHLLFDACCLAREIAQVIELRPTHAAAPLDVDVGDRGTVSLKYALDTFAMRDLPHGERRVESSIAHGDDDTFARLHAFAVALDHLHVDHHGVTRP